MKYAILHGRDPDSACDVTLVAIDDSGTVHIIDSGVAEFDADPGAGYAREDWDESTESSVEYAREFGGEALANMVRVMRDEYADNEFIV